MIRLTKGDIMDNEVINNDVNNINNGSNNKKKIIIGIIGLLIIIVLFISFSFKKKDSVDDDGLIYNKNKSFVKEQVVEGLTFSNIKCTYDGKDSLISYTISNSTDKDISLKNYNVLVKNKKGIVVTTIVADFGSSVKANDSVSIVNSVVGVDLSDAYSMELKLVVDKK